MPPCMGEADRFSLEALRHIHKQLDDDNDGGIEVNESVEVSAPRRLRTTTPSQFLHNLNHVLFILALLLKYMLKKVVLVPQIITGSKPPLVHMEASHDIEAPVSHDIIAPVSHDIKAPDQTVYTSYPSYSCRYLDQVQVDSQTLPSGC